MILVPLRFRHSILSAAGRLYPFQEGQARLSNYALSMRLVGQAPFATWTSLRNRTRIKVVNDYVGRSALIFGDLDRTVTTVLTTILRPGDCLLDIGANVGVETLFAAKSVGHSGLVHSFEPQPALAAFLRDSLAENSYVHVHVHEVALSDADGELPLRVPVDNRGGASLDAQEPLVDDGSTTVTAQVRHASAYLRRLDLPRIRAMKVDIEGHEERFFRGATALFAENPPAVIVFEEHRTPAADAPTVRLLRGAGYDLYGIVKRRLRLQLRPLEADGPPIHKDLVAIHRSADAAEIRAALRLDA